MLLNGMLLSAIKWKKFKAVLRFYFMILSIKSQKFFYIFIRLEKRPHLISHVFYNFFRVINPSTWALKAHQNKNIKSYHKIL